MSLINAAAVAAVLSLSPTTELANKCRFEGDIASTMSYGRGRGLSYSDTLAILDEQGLQADFLHVAMLVYMIDDLGPREMGNYVEQSCLEHGM